MKIKKIWILLIVGVLTMVVVGCAARKQEKQIDQMTSLAEILSKTAELSQQFQRGEITADQLATLTHELEDKYAELAKDDVDSQDETLEIMQKNIDEKFEGLKEIGASEESCTIPVRAEKLGITKPQGLTEEECGLTSAGTDGFDSLSMSYQGDYETAIQQAKIIAEKADIPLSKEFELAQKSMDKISQDELNQITEGGNLKGVVYTNAGLLETDMEYIITIAVDEGGVLSIEVVNFAQMKK